MLEDKTILITGGTGSFGKAYAKFLVKNFKFKKLIIFSRDEMKQWEMAKQFADDHRVRFFIGDVRDKERLYRAFDDVDIVIHAAAMKIVTAAEYNPFECVKTNILGSMNVIDAAIDRNISKVVALSTDKASSPINLYGATKLAADKLFIAANSYSAGQKTRLSVVRYGNVMGSRGSVIPYFMSLKQQDSFPITDEKMTRFMISLEEGVDLVNHAIADMQGGETYVKKIPSMKVVDIARAINPSAKLTFVGIRPGEKLHEEMIHKEDAQNTVEFPGYYLIQPWGYDLRFLNHLGEKGQLVEDGFVYSSDTNREWMPVEELKRWIEKIKWVD